MACSLLAALALAAQLDPAALVPLYRQALAEREKQFGSEHPMVARSASDLGLFLRSIGDREGAALHLARALRIDEKTFGPTHPTTAQDMENLASIVSAGDAIALHRKAAECPNAEISARNWGKLGSVYADRGDKIEAARAYRHAIAKEQIASGPAHPRVAVRLNDLAQVLDPKAAEPVIRRALAIEQKSLGMADPATATTLNNLANVLLALNRVGEAEAAGRSAVGILTRTLGSDHPRVATATGNMAGILRAKGDLAGSKRLYRRALAIRVQAQGPIHAEVAEDLRNLADLLLELGEKQEATRLLDRAASISGVQ